MIHDWLPGVLCDKQLLHLFETGVIAGSRPADFGKSSIDLTISGEAWKLPFGALKPSADQSYGDQRFVYPRFFEQLQPSNTGDFVLEPKTTYLFKSQQVLRANQVKDIDLYGQATAKSSIGRLDALTRLIVDGMDCYEGFTPSGIRNGEMFIEITPLSFPILVRAGTPVTQLRIFLGAPDACEIHSKHLHKATLLDGPADGYLRVNLSDAQNGATTACAFRATPIDGVEPVPIFKAENITKPCPKKYWTPMPAELGADGNRFLRIDAGAFYILRSKEKLALHSSTAVYCLAIDESIGEMRIHYAGFVHPWFGRDRDDDEVGTPLIFEVRGHDVPVVLRDGEKLAKLRYYQMSEQPEKKIEQYSKQNLNLSTFFAPWT